MTVLGSNSRSFNSVLERAQKLLRKTFAMELVELQSRNYREQDVAAGDDLQEARNATGVKKKGMSYLYLLMLMSIFLFSTAAVAGSKTYILRSTLDPAIIEYAARTDERLYEEQIADGQEDGDDDDDMPRTYGSIISWSSSDQLGALGVLHTILALILVNGRSISDCAYIDLSCGSCNLTIHSGSTCPLETSWPFINWVHIHECPVHAQVPSGRHVS